MASKQKNPEARRLRSSYISSVVSITLVLFMLGILGLVLINAKRISDYVKENIQLTVMLKDNADAADVSSFQRSIGNLPSVKSAEYITKDEAAKRLQKDLGEDFVSFLGYNPLQASIDIRLKANDATPQKIKEIEAALSKNKIVSEVIYQKSLVDVVNENVKVISIILLAFSGLFFIIAVALINNTIRLSLYSKRFLIKSMQLVGATKGFIRKPFVKKGITQGFYGSLISILFLAGLIYIGQRNLPALNAIQEYKLYAVVFLLMLIGGLIISWISTALAVRKYLRQKLDELYY